MWLPDNGENMDLLCLMCSFNKFIVLRENEIKLMAHELSGTRGHACCSPAENVHECKALQEMTSTEHHPQRAQRKSYGVT